MSNTYLFPVYSNPMTQFTEALGAAAVSFTPPFVASAMYNLQGVPPIAGRQYLIRAIMYEAAQNFGLEFDFFGSALGLTNVLGTDTFISRYQFSASNGAPIGAGALYRYYVDGLAIPYYDLDSANSVNPPTLHVVAQNDDTVAKSASPAGGMQATFWLEPMQAW